MSKEQPTYWGFNGDDRLTCTTIDELVEKFYDEYEGNALPEEIEIVGFNRMIINDNNNIYSKNVINGLLESLDEEYGNPDDDYTSPTPSMTEAAKEFVSKILVEYEPWACEEVCKLKVKILDYISQERLDEDGVTLM